MEKQIIISYSEYQCLLHEIEHLKEGIKIAEEQVRKFSDKPPIKYRYLIPNIDYKKFQETYMNSCILGLEYRIKFALKEAMSYNKCNYYPEFDELVIKYEDGNRKD